MEIDDGRQHSVVPWERHPSSYSQNVYRQENWFLDGEAQNRFLINRQVRISKDRQESMLWCSKHSNPSKSETSGRSDSHLEAVVSIPNERKRDFVDAYSVFVPKNYFLSSRLQIEVKVESESLHRVKRC